MTITAASRTHLKAARDRSHAAREQISRCRRAITLAEAQGDESAATPARMALSAATGELELASELENALLFQVAGISDSYGAASFLDDPDTIRTLESAANSTIPLGRLALGTFQTPEQFASTIESGSWGTGMMAAAGTDVALPDQARLTAPIGVRSALRRPLRLLDLVPTQVMNGLSFTYVQEIGVPPSGYPSGVDAFTAAAETSESSLKPQSTLPVTDAEVRAKTVAHFFKVARQQLADVSSLSTVLYSRLTYGVLRRIENQLIAGDGLGENLIGLTNTPGVGNIAYSPGQLAADQALSGLVSVMLAEAEPNAILVNPNDWGAMLKAKSSGSGEYLNETGPFIATAQNLWGTVAIPTTAVAQGTVLVGDFNQMTLWIREAPNVRMSDADSDDFTRNKLTILGEARVGVAIWAPRAFCIVHLS